MNLSCVLFRCWWVNGDLDASNKEITELLSSLYWKNVEEWGNSLCIIKKFWTDAVLKIVILDMITVVMILSFLTLS